MKYSLRSLIPQRSWFQFSIRTLLLVFVVIAATASWYGYRQRLLELERRQLSGKWEITVHGHVIQTFDFSDQSLRLLVPAQGVGRVDFQMAHGTGLSRGIYRWEGDELTVAQAHPGHPRPTAFEKSEWVNVWKATRRP